MATTLIWQPKKATTKYGNNPNSWQGFGLRLACALLCKYEHAHGVNGRCISSICETSGGTVPRIAVGPLQQPPTQQPLAQALQAATTPWRPELFFLGSAGACWGVGVGSANRWLHASLYPPKGTRQEPRPYGSKPLARAAAALMSEQEKKARVSAYAATLGAAGGKPHAQV